MFYDSYVDSDGKIVLRTLVQNSGTKAIETRKRIAKRFNSKGQIIESDIVQARIQDSTPYNLYSYSPDTEYQPIKTTFTNGYMTYDSILNLLHNPQTKVSIITKQGNKIESIVDHEIKQVQGSTVTLKNGTKIPLTEIKQLQYPVTESTKLFSQLNDIELTDNSDWVDFKSATIGEHIAFKKKITDNFLTEGVVLGIGKRGDDRVLIYKSTSDNGKPQIGSISESNVRYVSSPPAEFHVSVEESAKIQNFVNTAFMNNGVRKNLTEVFIAPKEHSVFKDLGYSVQQVNKFSRLLPKDLLYDMEQKNLFKVVHSGPNFVKATILLNNEVRYFNIPKELLDRFLLFTKTPIQESFAQSFFRKNRANLYKDKQENSIETKV
jgi:hypothetical protein